MVDDRSPTAKAMSVVMQITTIALVAILPLIAGFYLDRWLETKPLLVLGGMVVGFIAAGLQLARLIRKLENDRRNNVRGPDES